MMTQADILGRNQDSYLDSGSARINKPTGFDEQFPEGHVSSLSEQSPIRPSKYFATDSAINTSKGLRKIITGGLVFSLIITLALFIQIIIGGSQVPNRIGIVTQENVCSEIGAQMVRMGGNSVDAYIASLLCLSVVNPFAAGLGAGGFLVIRDHKHDQNYAVNCFFRSSASVTPPANNPVVGISSIATPGELKCLQHAYHKYARFYWKTLTAPSIDLALNGFKMSSSLAKYVHLLDITDIKNDPQLAAMFLNSNGTLKREGDLVKNPELARTLSLLNRQEYLLYHSDGSVGRDLVKELAENNNGKEQITEGDLTSYLAAENELERFRFNDFMLFTSGYPSSGPSIRFIMELIKELNINLDYLKTADFYNRLLEASKLGYILASDASDPSFAPDQKLTFDNKLTAAKTYIKNLNSSEYPFEKTNVQIKDNFYVNFISVNDHNDYMVSYVGTLGSVWGSKFISKNGFFLNNGLSLFSYKSEDKYNTPDVNKQPRGLMAPILTYNVKNPCIRRFAISYGHKGEDKGEEKGEEMNDDLAFSELAQVITKILTDFSLYETALTDKRAQFGPGSSESQVCFEDGFDSTVSSQVLSQGKFKASNSCMFHPIDLIMKKDHVVYGQADLKRSTDSLVVFN